MNKFLALVRGRRVFPSLVGAFLPTVYTIVALFAVLSGIHYIFHVARLMKEEDQVQNLEQ